jgi:signal transduction histidine kinase
MISIQSPQTESASAIVAVRARKVMPVTAYLPRDVRLATLAHELRSPLAAIQFATVALQGKTVDRGSLRALALIERQVLRMSHLLAGLAERPGARLPPNALAQPVCLCSVVRNAIETLAPDYRLHRHHLSVAFSAQAPKVSGDALRLEQVFVNLLGNASRYTDDGGEISVRVWSEGAVACVRILDSGIGIAADELPHIFDTFRQANTADPRSHAGSGIGLAVVRTLVAAHNGSVTVSSAGRGRGCEFVVRLPLSNSGR